MWRLRTIGSALLLIAGVTVFASQLPADDDKATEGSKTSAEMEVSGSVENVLHTSENGSPSYAYFELRGDDRVFKVSCGSHGIRSLLLREGMNVKFRCKVKTELDGCHDVLSIKRTRKSPGSLVKEVEGNDIETKEASRNAEGKPATEP